MLLPKRTENENDFKQIAVAAAVGAATTAAVATDTAAVAAAAIVPATAVKNDFYF